MNLNETNTNRRASTLSGGMRDNAVHYNGIVGFLRDSARICFQDPTRSTALQPVFMDVSSRVCALCSHIALIGTCVECSAIVCCQRRGNMAVITAHVSIGLTWIFNDVSTGRHHMVDVTGAIINDEILYKVGHAMVDAMEVSHCHLFSGMRLHQFSTHFGFGTLTSSGTARRSKHALRGLDLFTNTSKFSTTQWVKLPFLYVVRVSLTILWVGKCCTMSNRTHVNVDILALVCNRLGYLQFKKNLPL